MSLEGSMVHALSEVKMWKPHHDLEAAIAFVTTDEVMPDGTIWPATYRGRFHARRHLLMDKGSAWRRRQYHKAARRYYKAEVKARLAEARLAEV